MSFICRPEYTPISHLFGNQASCRYRLSVAVDMEGFRITPQIEADTKRLLNDSLTKRAVAMRSSVVRHGIFA